MSKAYKVIAKKIFIGDRKGETVYTVRPVSYGLLTTEEVAKQISTESTATPADVKAVLDRYAYYVRENLKKGYSVELLGFGTLAIRFVISHSVSDPKQANAKLVSGLLPSFRPSFTVHNGMRVYSLIPDKIALVNYDSVGVPENGTPEEPTDPDNTPSGGSGTTSGGGTTGGDDDSFV